MSLTRTELYKLLDEIKEPIDKILFLQKHYENLPIQGSEEWARSRKIGASMAAGVLGCSKFSSSLDVAKQILGLSDDEKNIQMCWGNIFEPATKLLLSEYIKIYEFGSVPGFGINGNIYTSCSPDGVFIMTPSFALKHVNNVNDYIGKIMLLEIKCPFMRPIKDEIPEYYYPQLYLGMRTINICEASSFCEFAIRMCSLQDFNFTGSCRVDKQRSVGGFPIAIGLIFAYGEDLKINSYDPVPITQYEIPDFEGSILDQFHQTWQHIDKHYPTCIEIERFHVFNRKFGEEHFMNICKYFKRIIPKWDYIDFGAVNNYSCKWCPNFDKELIKIKKFEYLKPLNREMQNDWTCKEYLVGELEKAEKLNLIGVIPYKIYTAQVQFVEKKDFKEEIKNLCIFGQNIEIIKTKPQEKWLAYAELFCKMFNKSVMGIETTNTGSVEDT